MKAKEALNRIKEIDLEAERLAEERKELLPILVDACPIKAGHIVEVTEYAYKGSLMFVDKVLAIVYRRTYGDMSYNNYIVVKGRVIKQNGEPGERRAESHYPVTL